jgi:endonuclease III
MMMCSCGLHVVAKNADWFELNGEAADHGRAVCNAYAQYIRSVPLIARG